MYRKFEIYPIYEQTSLLGTTFDFFCNKANDIKTFRLEHNDDKFISYKNEISTGMHNVLSNSSFEYSFTSHYYGLCQHCEDYKVHFLINGFTKRNGSGEKVFFIQKVGQLPAPESRPPKDIYDFLSEVDKEFYCKALRNLDFGYGIGAFAYFRRIIENEIDKIVDKISKLDFPDNNKLKAAIITYEKHRQKSKLIEEITPYLPKSLKEQGENIISILYATTSVGLHELSEEQCLEKAAHIDILFRYLVRKLNEEAIELSSIKDAIKKLK